MGEVVRLDEFRDRRKRVELEMLDARTQAFSILGFPVTVVSSPGVRVTLNGQPLAHHDCRYCAPDEPCAMHSPTSADLDSNLYFPPTA